MDRLSIYLTLVTGAVLTGSLVVAAFSLGWYGVAPVAIAVVAGFALSWPAAYLVSREIKRRDPHFDHRRARPGPIPDPRAPEV
jgi:predicted PurR-regulated permease PerM